MLFRGLEDKKELMAQAEQILQVFHCDANLYQFYEKNSSQSAVQGYAPNGLTAQQKY